MAFSISFETWLANVEILAEEFGLTAAEVHEILFRMLPEFFLASPSPPGVHSA